MTPVQVASRFANHCQIEFLADDIRGEPPFATWRTRQECGHVARLGRPTAMVEKLWGKQQSRDFYWRLLPPMPASPAASMTALGRTKIQRLAAPRPMTELPRSTTSPRARFICPTAPSSRRIRGSVQSLTILVPRNVKMHGVTPPHIYELKPREALFHGVPALRLTPIGGEEAIFGRGGLLAHTFMLGPMGTSTAACRSGITTHS